MKNATNKILAILIIVVLVVLFNTCNKADHYEKAYKVSNTQLKRYKDEKGLNVAEIEVLNIDKRELEKLVDSLKINRKTKSITVVDTKNVISIKEVTKVKYDTVKTKDTVYLSPVYTAEFNEFWYKGSAIATKDSFSVDIHTYDRFLMKREQGFGMFRDKPIYLDVTPQNPMSYNTDVKSYQVNNRGHLINVDVQLGTGYDVLRNQFVPWYAGFGIGFSLVR